MPEFSPEASALAKDLQSQIQALRVCYLQMANAVANQLPDRTKFFVDLMYSVDEKPLTDELRGNTTTTETP